MGLLPCAGKAAENKSGEKRDWKRETHVSDCLFPSLSDKESTCERRVARECEAAALLFYQQLSHASRYESEYANNNAGNPKKKKSTKVERTKTTEISKHKQGNAAELRFLCFRCIC